MLVFVINKHGKPLMPCFPRKARLLLKNKKAKIVNYKPFTIQLLYGAAGYTQETNLGIDTGSKHIGLAVTTQDKVLIKGQIDLRQDVKSLLETRKILRHSRRTRNTRYRKPRFLNRIKSKKENWLPPSVKSRVDNTINWISKFYKLLPKCKLTLEVGKFDIQKIENPDIQGVGYQQGELYQYRNRIAYLIARENNTCQFCKKPYKQGDSWRLHHIFGKDKDRPQDWALLHESCHIELHKSNKEKLLRKQKSKSYKESAFMNIIRRTLFIKYPDAKFTYGNVTFQDRCDLGLSKTHYNDAIAISGIKSISQNTDNVIFIKQFRKKKRSLHEATARKGRKIKNINAKRNEKNTKSCKDFCLNDKVKIFDKIGFISGFTGSASCYIKDIFDKYITAIGKAYKQVNLSILEFVNHNNNWQMAYIKESGFVSPA